MGLTFVATRLASNPASYDVQKSGVLTLGTRVPLCQTVFMFLRAFLVGLLVPGSVLANPVCLALASGDASLNDTEATCQTSMLHGGIPQNTCHWPYTYRADEALTRLDQLRAEIETCLGPDSALPADALVNHPDSFALYRYEGQGVHVALSLKDKAGLNQSLIFLSLSDIP